MRLAKNWLVSAVAVMALAAPAFAAEKDIVDTAVGAGSFNTLVAAVKAAGLVDTLKGKGPFTVFAPTDEAFAKLPAGTVESLLKPENKQKLSDILKYHVVPANVKAADVVKLTSAPTVNGQRATVKVADGGVKVDNANVVKTDIACTNGTIHVIDAVILPSADTIPTVADKAGAFKTLLAAAKAAGLVEALSAPGPITVFAPTDEAFAKLPAGTVESLLKPENKQKLADILKYHVVPGRIYSDDALKAKEAKTLQGGTIKIGANDKGAFINDAKLLKTDINASNGVIHVIDSVILPPAAAKKAAAVPMAAPAVAAAPAYYQNGQVVAYAQPVRNYQPAPSTSQSRQGGVRKVRRCWKLLPLTVTENRNRSVVCFRRPTCCFVLWDPVAVSAASGWRVPDWHNLMNSLQDLGRFGHPA
ncbi:MAG: fasciclin domain-containing protein, partial [Planctomycetaceae bacterium]